MSVTEWLGTTDDDYQNDANWTNLAPVAGSDVYAKSGANPIGTNLDNNAVLLNSFHLEQGFTGLTGLEGEFLKIQTPLLYIGTNPIGGNLNGPQRVNIDTGATSACDIRVEGSNSGATDTNRTPVRVRSGHASSRLFVTGGLVSFSDDPANTSKTLSLIDVSGGQLTVGEGCTLTDINVSNSGAILLQSTISGTANVLGGLLQTELAFALGTVNVKGGTFISNSSGTITTVNITGGVTDLSQSQIPRTITNCNLKGNSELVADPSVITFTNNIVMDTGKPLRYSSSEAA